MNIEDIAKTYTVPLSFDGCILEEDKKIGTCKRFDDVDLNVNHCPQGYIIKIYICKRCKYFVAKD